MGDACQVCAPSMVNQTACWPGSAGTATPWDAVVMPTKAKPPGGRVLRAAAQVAPPSAETSMPRLVARTIADGVPATEVAVPAAGAEPAALPCRPVVGGGVDGLGLGAGGSRAGADQHQAGGAGGGEHLTGWLAVGLRGTCGARGPCAGAVRQRPPRALTRDRPADQIPAGRQQVAAGAGEQERGRSRGAGAGARRGGGCARRGAGSVPPWRRPPGSTGRRSRQRNTPRNWCSGRRNRNRSPCTGPTPRRRGHRAPPAWSPAARRC